MERFRFGHVSDMHLMFSGQPASEVTKKLMAAGGDPTGAYRRTLEELAAEGIDALIMTGDLCHEGSEDDYAALREMTEKYLPGVPVLAAMGNHDVRDAFRKGFLGDRYGGDHPYCDVMEFPNKGIRFIAIDSAWEKGLNGSIGDDQLDWLEGVIASAQPGTEDILMFHHPVCPMLVPFGMEMSPRMERIIRGGRFAALFSGHVHRICTSFAAGILNIVGQSLAFDIEISGRICYYTTRGGYNMCEVDSEGELFIDSRIVSPKGEIFHKKSF